jgi:hypothetical protein
VLLATATPLALACDQQNTTRGSAQAPGPGTRAATGSHVSAAAGQLPDCIGPNAKLESDGIGVVRLGMPAAEVRRRCAVVRDTTQEAVSGGDFERVLIVRAGRDTLVASIDDDGSGPVVGQLHITSSTWATTDSIRVGLTLGALRRHGPIEATTGEVDVSASVPGHCGIAAALSGAGPSADENTHTAAEVARWADTIRIVRLSVSRCIPP